MANWDNTRWSYAYVRDYKGNDRVYFFVHNQLNNYKATAVGYSMGLQEYVYEIMNMTGDQLYSHCYDESARQIKLYLLIGGIAKKEELAVTEYELLDYINNIGYDICTVSDENICYLKYRILENKVLDYVHGLAIYEE